MAPHSQAGGTLGGVAPCHEATLWCSVCDLLPAPAVLGLGSTPMVFLLVVGVPDRGFSCEQGGPAQGQGNSHHLAFTEVEIIEFGLPSPVCSAGALTILCVALLDRAGEKPLFRS